MLFHLSLVHDGAHCPGFHPELMSKTFGAFEKREEIARRHNVKIHSYLIAAPEHLEILIVDAETPMSVAFFLSELYPFELAQIDMKAVQSIEDMMAMARERFGR